LIFILTEFVIISVKCNELRSIKLSEAQFTIKTHKSLLLLKVTTHNVLMNQKKAIISWLFMAKIIFLSLHRCFNVEKTDSSQNSKIGKYDIWNRNIVEGGSWHQRRIQQIKIKITCWEIVPSNSNFSKEQFFYDNKTMIHWYIISKRYYFGIKDKKLKYDTKIYILLVWLSILYAYCYNVFLIYLYIMFSYRNKIYLVILN
jgi:hypothetical protein